MNARITLSTGRGEPRTIRRRGCGDYSLGCARAGRRLRGCKQFQTAELSLRKLYPGGERVRAASSGPTHAPGQETRERATVFCGWGETTSHSSRGALILYRKENPTTDLRNRKEKKERSGRERNLPDSQTQTEEKRICQPEFALSNNNEEK